MFCATSAFCATAVINRCIVPDTMADPENFFSFWEYIGRESLKCLILLSRLGGVVEHCKLLQRSLGCSPSRKRL